MAKHNNFRPGSVVIQKGFLTEYFVEDGNLTHSIIRSNDSFRGGPSKKVLNSELEFAPKKKPEQPRRKYNDDE